MASRRLSEHPKWQSLAKGSQEKLLSVAVDINRNWPGAAKRGALTLVRRGVSVYPKRTEFRVSAKTISPHAILGDVFPYVNVAMLRILRARKAELHPALSAVLSLVPGRGGGAKLRSPEIVDMLNRGKLPAPYSVNFYMPRHAGGKAFTPEVVRALLDAGVSAERLKHASKNPGLVGRLARRGVVPAVRDLPP